VERGKRLDLSTYGSVRPTQFLKKENLNKRMLLNCAATFVRRQKKTEGLVGGPKQREKPARSSHGNSPRPYQRGGGPRPGQIKFRGEKETKHDRIRGDPQGTKKGKRNQGRANEQNSLTEKKLGGGQTLSQN